MDCGHWVTLIPWRHRLRPVFPPAAHRRRDGKVRCPVHGPRTIEEMWTRDEMGKPVTL